MAANSKIQWTNHTFNPWRGCAHVSPGCERCYAEVYARRFPRIGGTWGPVGDRVIASEAAWREPLRWGRAAEKAGKKAYVFCASLADVFEIRHDLDAPRARLFDLIEETPNLIWMLLTKRPGYLHLLMRRAKVGWPCNAWLGVTAENQEMADERIPILAELKRRYRIQKVFVSCEPLLGPVDLFARDGQGNHLIADINWIICGGESGGRHARDMRPDWARSLRDQCQNAGVPFFFKQWGYWKPFDLEVRDVPAGRLLDGREWNERPES